MDFDELMVTMESDIIALEGANFNAIKVYSRYSKTITNEINALRHDYENGKQKECLDRCDKLLVMIDDYRNQLHTLINRDNETIVGDVIGAALAGVRLIAQNIVSVAAIIGITASGKAIGAAIREKTPHDKLGAVVTDKALPAAVIATLTAKCIKWLNDPVGKVTTKDMKKDRSARNLIVNDMDNMMITSYKLVEQFKVKVTQEMNAIEAIFLNDEGESLACALLFDYVPEEFIELGFDEDEAVAICAEAAQVFASQVGIANEANAIKTAFNKYKLAVADNINKRKAFRKYQNGSLNPPGDKGITNTPNGVNSKSAPKGNGNGTHYPPGVQGSTVTVNGYYSKPDRRDPMAAKVINIESVPINFFGKKTSVPAQLVCYTEDEEAKARKMLDEFTKKSGSISSKYAIKIMNAFNDEKDYLDSDEKRLKSPNELVVDWIFIDMSKSNFTNIADGVILSVYDNTNNKDCSEYEPTNVPFKYTTGKFEWIGRLQGYDNYFILNKTPASEGFIDSIKKLTNIHKKKQKNPGVVGTTQTVNGINYEEYYQFVPRKIDIILFGKKFKDLPVEVVNYGGDPDPINAENLVRGYAAKSASISKKIEKEFCEEYKQMVPFKSPQIGSEDTRPSTYVGLRHENFRVLNIEVMCSPTDEKDVRLMIKFMAGEDQETFMIGINDKLVRFGELWLADDYHAYKW